MVIFCFSHSFYIYWLGLYYKEQLTFAHHLFVAVWTQGYSFYFVGHDSFLSLFNILLIFGHLEVLQVGSYVVLEALISFWAFFLLSSTTRCSGSFPIFPAIAMELTISPRVPGSFNSQKAFRN